jgi:hypothetical protein
MGACHATRSDHQPADAKGSVQPVREKETPCQPMYTLSYVQCTCTFRERVYAYVCVCVCVNMLVFVCGGVYLYVCVVVTVVVLNICGALGFTYLLFYKLSLI